MISHDCKDDMMWYDIPSARQTWKIGRPEFLALVGAKAKVEPHSEVGKMLHMKIHVLIWVYHIVI